MKFGASTSICSAYSITIRGNSVITLITNTDGAIIFNVIQVLLSYLDVVFLKFSSKIKMRK